MIYRDEIYKGEPVDGLAWWEPPVARLRVFMSGVEHAMDVRERRIREWRQAKQRERLLTVAGTQPSDRAHEIIRRVMASRKNQSRLGGIR